MGEVYRVLDVASDTKSVYAMKVMKTPTSDSEELAKRRTLFRREATILASLRHPNLPQIIDFFSASGLSCLVMEYVDGLSLQRILDRNTAHSGADERRVLHWCLQICDVLSYLHTRQPPVIFRDLKPSNIMLTQEDTIKLIDFGIARIYKPHQTHDTIQIGTMCYASPELLADRQTDQRSDLYSLGATMYHLLTGQPPEPAGLPHARPFSALAAHVSRHTVYIVQRAMSHSPADRFQTALEMRREILHSLSELTPKPTTDRLCPRCKSRARVGARYCAQCGRRLDNRPEAYIEVSCRGVLVMEFALDRDEILLGRLDLDTGAVPDLDFSSIDHKRCVSRRHAVIRRSYDGYELLDLNSTNGTLLNNRKLSPNKVYKLHNGDHIRICDVELTVNCQ